MATLQGAIDEFIIAIDAVSGVGYAPEDPPAQLNTSPVAVVFASFGRFGGEPTPGMTKGLHDVQVALLMLDGTMPQQVQILLPMLEPVVAAIYNHRNGRTSSHYDTFASIDYAFGPVEWNGISSTGFIFTVRGVKIQNTI